VRISSNDIRTYVSANIISLR